MRPAFGSWLGFVKSEDGLSSAENEAYQTAKPFLEALETTEMSKSYKMLVLLAMLNRDQFPGSLSVTDLANEVALIGQRDARIGADFGDSLNNQRELQSLLKRNPIDAWVSGRGTGGTRYFSFESDRFSSQIDMPAAEVKAVQELTREIVDWRLSEYLDRSRNSGAAEFTLKVSHSDGRPILFLQARDTFPNLPEGWTEVRINDETVNANFVKVAINVVHRPGANENVLPEILRKWFGDDAGRPGTRHQMVLRQEGTIWYLTPVGANAIGAVAYKAYPRAEIAPLYGLTYSAGAWNQGSVNQDKHTFLLVTLEKAGHTEALQYKDHFVSPSEFQWQSQNRTTQASDAGQSIQLHIERGIAVHLFVRAKPKTPDGRGAPFLYCGPVEFVSWSGEKPITVQWKLQTPVPSPLWTELEVPKPCDTSA
jgi:hypothetical protein